MFPKLSQDVLVCLARYRTVNILVLNIIAAPAARQWNGTTGNLNRKTSPIPAACWDCRCAWEPLV